MTPIRQGCSVWDYVPFVSTVTNSVKLYRIYQESRIPSIEMRDYTPLKTRSICLLFPVIGNLIMLINDIVKNYFDPENQKIRFIEACKKAKTGKEIYQMKTDLKRNVFQYPTPLSHSEAIRKESTIYDSGEYENGYFDYLINSQDFRRDSSWINAFNAICKHLYEDRPIEPILHNAVREVCERLQIPINKIKF